MTQPQTSDLIRAALAAAALCALSSCVAREPGPATHFNEARATTVVVPYVRPYGAAPTTGRLCLLGSNKCSEMFPQPARLCLLAAEPCPRDGTIQRIETPLFVPRR
jgi:hypothetical protein